MGECAEPVWVANLIAALPPTIVALGALVTSLRLRPHLLKTEQRAEQLFNGEFARGRTEGRRIERTDPGAPNRDFPQI